MTMFARIFLDRLIPDLPQGIREDFFVHAATELQRHAPWLFAAMFVNSLIALATGSEQTHWIVRFVLPGLMAAYCLFSMTVLRKDWDFASKPWRARKFLRESSLSSCFGALVCTAWCVFSWLSAPADERMHFPIILVMGGLATAYCLSSSKAGAYANLAIDLIPISLLMIFLGSTAEQAAAISLLLAGAFQILLIRSHHRRVIQLLHLQQQARMQAQTDPLTGLANRRALLEKARERTHGDHPFGLMLIDVDHFKRINDEFGHDCGDSVLCELAEIIASHAPPGSIPARIGGEEFAIFGPCDILSPANALALLSEIRNARMPHGEQVTVSIGVAHGTIGESAEWRALYASADEALYDAKRSGRNRIVFASDEDKGLGDEASEPGFATGPAISSAA